MKIFKITLLLSLYLIVSSCGTSKDVIIDDSISPIDKSGDIIQDPYGNNEKGNPVYEPEIVGNDSDEHGCKASAGYSWSTLKKECIRVFELKMQLSNSDKTKIAGLIFSEDQLKAEIITSEGTFLLEKYNDMYVSHPQSDPHYFLRKKNGKWVFETEEKILYSEL